MRPPAAEPARVAQLVDGVFLHHLPAIVAQRRRELDLPEAALAFEVDNHRAFYDFALDERPDVVAAWGPDLERRIRRRLAEPAPDAEQIVAVTAAVERPVIEEILAVEDRQWLAPLVDVAVQNALALALDHPPSRLDAKALVRSWGARLPAVDLGEVASRVDLVGGIEQLRDLSSDAARHGVLHLAAVCQAIADGLDGIDLAQLDRYAGDRVAGYGGCGTCSMMYASSAVVSLDPTCPGVFDDGGVIALSLDLNVSRCPFCFEVNRVESPAMFYSPRRNQVIYNAPTLGQFSPAEALDVHRPTLSAIRDRYMHRVAPTDALAFDRANEEFTHEMAEFLLAVQMGTTAREDHISLVIALHDGSGLIVDPTKGVRVQLTPQELRARCVDTGGGVSPGELANVRVLEDAVVAYGNGDYELARRLLEQAHAEQPGDDAVRRNLAVVYHALGQEDLARAVLRVRARDDDG